MYETIMYGNADDVTFIVQIRSDFCASHISRHTPPTPTHSTHLCKQHPPVYIVTYHPPVHTTPTCTHVPHCIVIPLSCWLALNLGCSLYRGVVWKQTC